jgi:hypothetical protein
MISFVRRSKNYNSQRIVSHVAMAKQKVIPTGLASREIRFASAVVWNTPDVIVRSGGVKGFIDARTV